MLRTWLLVASFVLGVQGCGKGPEKDKDQKIAPKSMTYGSRFGESCTSLVNSSDELKTLAGYETVAVILTLIGALDKDKGVHDVTSKNCSDGVAKLATVTSLDLSQHPSLSDFGAIFQLHKITSVDLSKNKHFDAKQLALLLTGLQNLQTLKLADSPITVTALQKAVKGSLAVTNLYVESSRVDQLAGLSNSAGTAVTVHAYP